MDVRWAGWYGKRPLSDFAFWYEVAVRVKAKRIRKKDHVKVLAVCDSVEREFNDDY